MTKSKRIAFAQLPAGTVIFLPWCPNGCGEMIMFGDGERDEGFTCPICDRYMTPQAAARQQHRRRRHA
jgi:hypothetical protein